MSGLAYHLAQLNIAHAVAPLDDPRLADFMAALDRVNTLADVAPGFVWRLQGDSGNATDIRHGHDSRLLVNLSVWEGVEPLFDFVYRSAHTAVMARRGEWFEKPAGPHLVLWWLPAGAVPSVDEAMARLARLAAEGPTPAAFTFKQRFAAPAVAAPAGLADAAR